jgi:hypothetical protein
MPGYEGEGYDEEDDDEEDEEDEEDDEEDDEGSSTLAAGEPRPRCISRVCEAGEIAMAPRPSRSAPRRPSGQRHAHRPGRGRRGTTTGPTEAADAATAWIAQR